MGTIRRPHLLPAIMPMSSKRLGPAASITLGALQRLQALASELERSHPAAASLREGMEETLTVTRLGIKGPLVERAANGHRAFRRPGAVGHDVAQLGTAIAQHLADEEPPMAVLWLPAATHQRQAMIASAEQ